MKSRTMTYFLGMLACAVLLLPSLAHAQWKATVGSQSADQGRQALAFLPNEIWIHVGDSITWTWRTNLIHTLTFLKPGQPYPTDFTVGCPGFSSNPASFDGSTCVTTQAQVMGQTFTVGFPKAGNYKFECLVHLTMTGVVHVLELSEPLPHNQNFYNEQAVAQRNQILHDTDPNQHHGDVVDDDDDHGFSVHVIRKHVTAGFGDERATPGGLQQLAIERFLKDTVEIHVGDTVEWGNFDPDEPHTITIGAEPPPPDQFPPSSNVFQDSDGVPHAIVNSTTENVHSGFILAVLQDEPGIPTNPLAGSPTRFRITFNAPGTYHYRCVLHENLGMMGRVVVLP